MKPILLTLPLFLVACAVPPGTTEDVASLSQAIDPTHNPPPPKVSLAKFEVIPALPPPVAFPPLKSGVFDIAPFLPGYDARLPTLIWGLKKAGITTLPAYLPCNPAYQFNEDLCYEDYQLTNSECDATERTSAQLCANLLNTCQTSTCLNDEQQCYESIPACENSSCFTQEFNDQMLCQENYSLCTTQIESNGFCGNNFTTCLGAAQSANGNCRTVAQYNYQQCSNQIGLCI